MNFIKKMFDGEIENSVHLQFQKFGKGEFNNRALIKVKKTKDRYTIYTSNEFANEFVRVVAERLGEEKTRVTGAIISTSDLTGELEFKDKKQFQGVKKYILDNEMSGNEIIMLLDKLPKAFFALSFDAGENKLKIKPKGPKSPKSNSKKEEKPKINFCKIVTNDSNIGKAFVFEKPDFKEAEINHKFIINELILPEDKQDYAKVREIAKRKGKIVREAIIDGQEITSEKEFIA